MATEKMKCPKCRKEPTGKYRDEEKIDGMYCRSCSVAWNVDWEEQKPLYDTTIDIGYSQALGKDEFNPNESEFTDEYSMDYHLNTISDTLDYINNDRRIRKRSGEGTEQLDSMIHDLTKIVRLLKGIKELK
ncbi:MAG: hypothetical protein H8E16_04280 [Flavobacteriales bacterium]|nr:hypothetical protein [Flavobacteriales bacterium]